MDEDNCHGRTTVEEWFRSLGLAMTREEFEALPAHPDYKYEFGEGRACLSPRPKAFHARLVLRPGGAPKEAEAQRPGRIRRLRDDDWEALPSTFAAAFVNTQPFASLPEDDRHRASRELLEVVRKGGEGPVVREACLVAESERARRLVGAALITLCPDRPLNEWGMSRWDEPPPPDAIERRLGRPHLTWIFVEPMDAGHGIGSAMLASASEALCALGYRELASTFYSGNARSVLWHWRNGFQLCEWPGSMRKVWGEVRGSRRASEQSQAPTCEQSQTPTR